MEAKTHLVIEESNQDVWQKKQMVKLIVLIKIRNLNQRPILIQNQGLQPNA